MLQEFRTILNTYPFLDWAILTIITYGVFRLFKSQSGILKFIAGIPLFSLSYVLLQKPTTQWIWLFGVILAYREEGIKWYWEIFDLFYEIFNYFNRLFHSIAFFRNRNRCKFREDAVNYESEAPNTATEEPGQRSSAKYKREAEEARKEAQRAREEAEHARQEAEKLKQSSARADSSSKKEDNRSPWEVLGVSPNASKDEIKRAYRECCQRYHPDKYASRPDHIRYTMEEELKKVQQAYRILNTKP